MIITIAGVSVAAYILFGKLYSRKKLMQAIAFASIYLAGLTFVEVMDVLLPIYIVVSTAVIVPYMRHVSRSTLFLCIYYFIYLIYGILFQESRTAIVTFLRFWQFIIFFLSWDSDLVMNEKIGFDTLWLSLVTETVLGCYLLYTHTASAGIGTLRLAAGAQVITGNLSLVVLPVSVYLYFSNRGNGAAETKIIAFDLFFLLWIILSGTRGYILVYGMTLPFVFWDYFFHENSSNKNRIVFVVFVVSLIVLVLLVFPGIIQIVVSIIRADQSTGIRPVENAITLEFFKTSPFRVKLFGVGLGGRLADYPSFVNAVFSQDFFYSTALNKAGGAFHNLYDSVFLSTGVFGLLVVFFCSVIIWNAISKTCGKMSRIGLVLHVYLIGFLVMYYFRWSCTCGITELFVLCLILKKIKADRTQKEAVIRA